MKEKRKLKKKDPRDFVFIKQYLKHFSPYEAAIEAKFSKSIAKSDAYAWVANPDSKPHVYEAIEQAMVEWRKGLKVTADHVIEQLRCIAFANVKDIVAWDAKTVKIKDSRDIPEHLSTAISEVYLTEKGKVRVKMHSKVEALEKLCRYLGLYEKDNQQKTDITLTIRDILNDIDGKTAGLPRTKEEA